MTDVTRRAFLRKFMASLGAASGAWLLAACGQSPTASAPTEQPQPTVSPRPPATDVPGATAAAKPNPASAATPTTAAPAAVQYPYMAIAKGGDQPEELVNRAIAALGGMERFVKAGNDVIIKPNICVDYHTYEYAATTNPWVVGALVKLCKAAGASRVRVMDYPFGGTAEQAYTRSGIREQVSAAGGVMEDMAWRKFKEADIPQGQDLKKWNVYEDILKADVVINVPIAKHHSLARLTLGMKNMMGTIAYRESIHGNMGQRLADLTSRIKPALTVVDAVRILMANGPTGGDLGDVKKLDTVIATPDIVAADTYAASLFDVKPDELAYIPAGVKMGLGRSDLANLKIEQITVGG